MDCSLKTFRGTLALFSLCPWGTQGPSPSHQHLPHPQAPPLHTSDLATVQRAFKMYSYHGFNEIYASMYVYDSDTWIVYLILTLGWFMNLKGGIVGFLKKSCLVSPLLNQNIIDNSQNRPDLDPWGVVAQWSSEEELLHLPNPQNNKVTCLYITMV